MSMQSPRWVWGQHQAGRPQAACSALLILLGESLAFSDQTLQQRSRFPVLAVLLVKLTDLIQDDWQADLIGQKHRPATMGREAIARQENHIDVACASGDALFE